MSQQNSDNEDDSRYWENIATVKLDKNIILSYYGRTIYYLIDIDKILLRNDVEAFEWEYIMDGLYKSPVCISLKSESEMLNILIENLLLKVDSKNIKITASYAIINGPNFTWHQFNKNN